MGMGAAQLAAVPRGTRAATLGLAITLPVCAVIAAGTACRLVVRRRRRQQLRHDLEQQSLLRRQQQGKGSSGAASSGAARPPRPPRPASRVRPTEPGRLAALLHGSLAAGSAKIKIMPPAAASEGLAHQMGAAGSGFGGAGSLELCVRLPETSPADKVQAWMARGTASLPGGSAGAAAAAAAAGVARLLLPASPPSSRGIDSAGRALHSTIEVSGGLCRCAHAHARVHRCML